ncbi:MAG: hypothetical protein LBL57_11170 [Tannerella sp.]|jgi:uncharacterized membrane protein|nr:hypothetical protein [Tannerella sp.]
MAENSTVDPKDVQDNKVMAILAYLGILVLVPIFAAKESPFARFHANQGILLFIVSIVFYIIYYILLFTVPVVALIFSILSIGILILVIIGIINAAKGEMKELPIIGKYSILK